MPRIISAKVETMRESSSALHTQLKRAEPTKHFEFIGRPASAVLVIFMATVTSIGTAWYVGKTNSYLAIQYALPTYDGSLGPIFFVLGGVVLTLAILSAFIDAGLLPTVVLAGAPVLGWAVNHFTSTIAPHYAITFPMEMALLYGGLFGVVGYCLGVSARRTIPSPL